MDSPLDGPRLKVVRAREHLNALNFQQERFYKSEPYSITQESDAETGKRIYRIHVIRELPTRRIAALAGDCVHNLRSALDHLAWRLSEDFGGINDDDTSTQFPIFRTEAGYDSRGVNQIKRTGPGAAAVIRQLQPFHDQQPLVHPLWFIRELDNGDKHRSLAVTAVAAKNYAHRIRHAKDSSGVFQLNLSLEDIRDGAIIADLVILPKDAKVNVESTFIFEIAFTGPTVPPTKPRLFVVSFLDFLCNRVDGVINCFEPFYASGRYNDSALADDPLAVFKADPPRGAATLQRSDEEHQQWADRAKERIEEEGDKAWELAKPIRAGKELDPLSVTGADLLAALKQAAASGFFAGVEMAMERTEEVQEELDPVDLLPPNSGRRLSNS